MILKELAEAIGVSGDEGGARAVVLGAVREHVDEVKVDALGNVLALKRGTGEQPLRVMVAAHMDEIGLMVTGHDSDGFLRVAAVGGIDARLLPGSFLQVGPERIPGVIGLKPVHLLREKEDQEVSKIEDLVVDVGASSKDEAKKLAPLGTYAAFTTPFRELGPTVSGKA
ncbi:MAG TPA: M42 family peptidase, partial [Anaerolineae bacterium]|nr:M42 family peptidase [Anaerolineae bacterium]